MFHLMARTNLKNLLSASRKTFGCRRRCTPRAVNEVEFYAACVKKLLEEINLYSTIYSYNLSKRKVKF